MIGFLSDILLDAVFQVAVALFPRGNDRLQEWKRSDSPALRILSWLLIIVLFFFVIFLAMLIFFATR